MAYDPLIFYAILFRAVRGQILEIFTNFFFKVATKLKSVKDHMLNFKKIMSSDLSR
jgi:hypothetical protein